MEEKNVVSSMKHRQRWSLHRCKSSDNIRNFSVASSMVSAVFISVFALFAPIYVSEFSEYSNYGEDCENNSHSSLLSKAITINTIIRFQAIERDVGPWK